MKPNALVTVLLLAAANLCSHAMPATSQGAGGTAVQGEVLEVKDVEGYTYLRLKTKDGETWAAVATAPVKKGSTMSIANPMVMRNFESKSLKKTFDVIVFGSIADAFLGMFTLQRACEIQVMAQSGGAELIHIHVVMLRADDNRVDMHWGVAVIFYRDLTFSVGSEIGDLPAFARTGQLARQRMR